MSLNESVSERPEEEASLPNVYHRELTLKKNFSLDIGENEKQGRGGYSENALQEKGGYSENALQGRGGYREWKTKNGFVGCSERMKSSVGRAIHNRGIIALNDNSMLERENDSVSQSNFLSSSKNNIRDDDRISVNYSEPCYIPHNLTNTQHSNLPIYLSDDHHSNGTCQQHTDTPYNYSNRNNSVKLGSEENYRDKCAGSCCSNIIFKSPITYPQNHQGSQNTRGHLIDDRNMNHTEFSQNNYCGRNVNLVENHSRSMRHIPPYISADQHMPHDSIMYNQCHRPLPSHSCCQNKPPQNLTSPFHIKSNLHRKSQASIKKLYRILWLQNEQLGLLERQVSKLIEVNFNKETDDYLSREDVSASAESSVKSSANPVRKVDTCEVGVMANLRCPKCSSQEKKTSSSESEGEICKKTAAEESLTLCGVNIAVSEEDVTSPPVSMHIDLQDFQQTSETSSDETDQSDETDEESEAVGWTFYDNVVGQVNNMLQCANQKPRKKGKETRHGDMNMTIQELKRLGVTKSEPETSHAKRVTFEQNLKEQQINLKTQSEISMNFNALASKYLSSSSGKVEDISMCNLITSNTNMSIATMRYLHRHHITNNMEGIQKKNACIKSRRSKSSGERTATGKFLDITAIRQQPKLLPKDI